MQIHPVSSRSLAVSFSGAPTVDRVLLEVHVCILHACVRVCVRAHVAGMPHSLHQLNTLTGPHDTFTQDHRPRKQLAFNVPPPVSLPVSLPPPQSLHECEDTQSI